jgi:5-hydroxyisourate hydrolase
LTDWVTNHDGRAGEPLLPMEGTVFARPVSAGVPRRGLFPEDRRHLPNPPFIDRVSVDFAIYEEKERYHVSPLCLLWRYTTYRGS